ncbi:mannuronate-specific alginate lyase [Pseudomonas granadensis]|uniref:Alginate lyase n=1 Tax=Pseudomonas granadensis TaxID=1421430 RepID=A0ABX7GJA8_9PSED|nr:mannuronate-specific alginate lyase [Pseudomonas granadensis]MBN6774731.1 mannuronate-specific alginate lyase [Pseudomonas granadensis]MBN6805469.1 mannuronate-specific alginate lyase [Pseudomonas granadensis]MBN6832757.1 mannuronate-specific alginate lyase [Pseudomonas granadensis]MBN6839663.1 mannuronate-specific alginate lyase [Pseudomonas granadensis]MBN6869038.1 mannuronate-specific alginate lyase [Pseudomonas granadensis]
MRNRTIKHLLAPSLLTLAMFAGATQAAAPLRPPQGYFAPVDKFKSGDKSDGCDAMPAPYTGPLQFRSKYEGSDKARATLNVQSEKAFRDTTKDITTLERGTAKRVMQFMRDGRPEQLECTLNWLTAWAKADALMSKDFNHTGKSMRKWALGSMASSYIRLKFSDSHPLAQHQQEAQLIEAWFSKMADQVVSDWDNLPLEKTNNHSYWAAWSVMATAVATNRRDLFDWAVKEYKVGVNQVDADGYLPNELKRQQRALAYHNYALPPLAMIASFAQVNGVDLRQENNSALKRLGDRVLSGVKDPDEFEEKNGKEQDMTDLKEDMKFAWLEPFCTLYTCAPDVIEKKRDMQPFKTFRLGGDLTRVYDPSHEKGNKGS